MIKIFLLVVLSFSLINISAQTALTNSGAKNEALGSPVSIPGDEWALWRNPAGLTLIDKPIASSSIRRSSATNVLSRSALLAGSAKALSAGVGVASFGDEIYNENTVSLALANTLGLASIGIRGDITQLRIDGTPPRHAFGITIGCIARITHRLSIGITARNINLPAWARGQPLPVVLNTGVAYTPGDNFLLAAEVEKYTDFDPTLKGGFEYSVRKKFFFRTGFNLFPNNGFGGVGLRMWRLAVDYALKFGYLPGYSQQLSLTFQLRR